jgi:hypothetical protein
MKLKEVCKAFIDDKKLIDRYGEIYTRDGDGFLGDDGIETPYPFMCPANMAIYDGYDLTFQEVMSMAGLVRIRNEYTMSTYYMNHGILYDESGDPAWLRSSEVRAKWRVVE